MSRYLISVDALTNSGFTTIFLITAILIMHQGRVSLTGRRYPYYGLWCVNITATVPAMPATCPLVAPITNIDTKPTTPRNASTRPCTANHIIFLHMATRSPDLSTWINAIGAGYFSTLPRLTSALFHKNPSQSVTMVCRKLNHI